MNYLKIENAGELDIRLVSLMGGTTKKGSSTKIGQFGTGLKYVLAHMIRNRVGFKVYIAGKEVEISYVTESIANTDFEIVTINGEKTSITSMMGMEWEPWMVVRELYSNALDEGGAHYSTVSELEMEGYSSEQKTIFLIELTPAFLKVFNNWNKYFIVGNVPVYEDECFALHPSGENLKIYKQGILIKELEQKSVFNYDLKYASINEMRQYTGYTAMDVYNCLTDIKDKRVIEYFLENAVDGMFEADMDYDFGANFNTAWEEAIGNAKIIHKKAVEDIKARELDIDMSSIVVVPIRIYKALTKRFKGVGALRVADKIGDFYEVVNVPLSDKIDECIGLLLEAGYFMEPELRYTLGVFGDASILAKVDIDKKEVFISEKHANKSMFDTCAMLIEENEHFRTGFQDHSRQFQQHFIDMFTKALLDKAQIKL